MDVQNSIPMPGRKKRRRHSATRQERREIRQAAERGIDEIDAYNRSPLPREQVESEASAYARYSTDFQQGIGAQIRALFEWAINHRNFIPRDCNFFDQNLRGYRSVPSGLGRLQIARRRTRK